MWIKDVGSSNSPIAGFVYTLDLSGNRKSETDLSGRVDHYAYDNLGRLTTEAITDPVAGNRKLTYT